jgi:hypothetical protein
MKLAALAFPATIDLAKAVQNTKWLREVSVNIESGPMVWMQEQEEVCGIYAYKATNHRMAKSWGRICAEERASFLWMRNLRRRIKAQSAAIGNWRAA